MNAPKSPSQRLHEAALLIPTGDVRKSAEKWGVSERTLFNIRKGPVSAGIDTFGAIFAGLSADYGLAVTAGQLLGLEASDQNDCASTLVQMRGKSIELERDLLAFRGELAKIHSALGELLSKNPQE